MKAYVTKYALTEGIQECEGDLVGDRFLVKTYKGSMCAFFVGRWDWYYDLRTACERAESMRTKRIASLRRQIARLEGMEFK